MNSKHLLLILVLLAVAFTAGAQPPLPGQPFSINNLTGDLTLLVARVDPARLLATPAPDPDQDPLDLFARFAETQRPLRPFLEKIRAAGVGEFYVVCDLADLGPDGLFFLVAPALPGSNPNAVQALLAEAFKKNALFNGFEVARLRGAMVAGSPNVLKRLRGAPGGSGADWEARFKEIRSGLLQVQLLPYDGWQRVVEELMPTLPDSVGGGPSTAMTRGLKWASLSLEVPPEPALRLEIQSESPADAQALLTMLLAGLDTLATNEDVTKHIADYEQLATALTPTVDGSSLVISLDAERIRAITEGALATAVADRRDMALRTRSMVRLREVGVGFLMYAWDHEGATPTNFAQILPYLEQQHPTASSSEVPLPDDVAERHKEQTRRRLDELADYVYVSPGKLVKDIAAPARTVIAYEKPGTNRDGDSVNALFADGHVERLGSPEELQALLDQGNRDR